MVEITYLAIAGIALAAMFFGYGFGLFEGRSQGYKKGKAEAEQEEKEQPPAPPTTITVDDPGLLRLKNESGFLTLDLDGKRVDPSALSSPQRKRLIEMLNLMRPWLEGPPSGPAPSAAPAAPEAEQPMPERLSPSPTRGNVDPSQGKPAPPQASSKSKEDRPAAPANSIISQIDAILQARMVGTPLEARRVLLAQSPEGSLIVYVGLTRYMSVEDVPDAEVKAAIRAAISEWENKYTPGL